MLLISFIYIWFYLQSGCWVTGGEGGVLNLWTQGESSVMQCTTDCKSITKSNGKARDKRAKPY